MRPSRWNTSGAFAVLPETTHLFLAHRDDLFTQLPSFYTMPYTLLAMK